MEPISAIGIATAAFSTLHGFMQELRSLAATTKKRLVRALVKNLPQTEPRVRLRVGDHEFVALADSGAGINVGSLTFIQQVGTTIDQQSTSSIILPNGTKCKTLGTSTVTMRFLDEPTLHTIQCHVLGEMSHDLILGAPFLEDTQTLTVYSASRVQYVSCQMYSHCVNALSSRLMLRGRLNGVAVLAIPDTGSNITLISASYARQRGFHIQKQREHQKELRFVDGSTATTLGVVRDLWFIHGGQEVESNLYENGGHTNLLASGGHTGGEDVTKAFICDFYVLEGLQCDVLLANDFVVASDCFASNSKHKVRLPHHDGEAYCHGIREVAGDCGAGREEAEMLATYEKTLTEAETTPVASIHDALKMVERMYEEMMRSTQLAGALREWGPRSKASSQDAQDPDVSPSPGSGSDPDTAPSSTGSGDRSGGVDDSRKVRFKPIRWAWSMRLGRQKR